ncbi:MAG: hypothetical protein Fur002_21140 [Anaerolineales bacterium]
MSFNSRGKQAGAAQVFKRSFQFTLLLALIFAPLAAPARAQSSSPSPEALRILSRLSPEERVGQIFLVAFDGTDLAPDSEAYNLIARYHVGGATLLAENDNFFPEPDALKNTRDFIQNIQRLKWSVSSDPSVNVAYVPLFIAIAQDGNGFGGDQLIQGMTPLPSQMALGATWNTDLAARAGEILGRELNALGFNLLLGPSLDVMDSAAVSDGGLDARVFGGDPFWVAEMGRAYVGGLREGSQNHLFVAAKHFPGVGSSGRLPDDEVSTVRKSIEQLKQVELAPFFALTGGAPAAAVDGLLVSHIRYQGFQGNIRATTRPISFDAQALSQLLALPQLSGWLSQGGLLISDNLGARAVREFYTSGGGQFSARNAARDAFLAGNDMLYLGNITSGENLDPYATTVNIIEFFYQKYREDPAFAQRVDASAARILTAKLRLYENFSLTNALLSPYSIDMIGGASDLTFEVARSAATLISPEAQSLTEVMPLPPQEDERVVFITDTQMVKQCSTCAEQADMNVDALRQDVLRLLSPSNGSQPAAPHFTSYSLDELRALLDAQNTDTLEADLSRANWIVISLRGAAQGQPDVVNRFLRERPNLLREKRIILFSFGAPYYFDSTAISKFTAYFALYSKQPPFIDVAARLLMQELPPVGSSPVSVPGVGYDLISVMSPDPAQVILLTLDLPAQGAPTETALTPAPTNIPYFQIGDTIAVRTGVILDYNGRPVPDGTVVQFSVLLTGEGGGILKQAEAVTTQGIARASFGLDKPGLLEIKASSEPALISETLQLDVSQAGGAAVTVIAPQSTVAATPVPQDEVIEVKDPYISSSGYPLFSAWFFIILLIAVSMWLTYFIAVQMAGARAARRSMLGLAIGGLTAYNFLVFGWMNLNLWLLSRGLSGALSFVFIGELAGLAAGIFWSRQRRTS